jgi:hypothetical protein
VLGDGTVNTNSATLPITERWADGISMPGSHVSLVGNAKDLIADYLYPPLATTNLLKSATMAAIPFTFLVTFNGWLQPYLADFQGKAVGFNLTSGVI